MSVNALCHPAYPRKTLHESTKILSVGQGAVCCWDTDLNPGLMINSRALDAEGSVMTIDLSSIN